MSTAGLDRRTRRRQETIEEILEVAIELMETEGVAALSLSAVARRLGMQPPSLYQYFPSKMAIYDALFQRGAELVLAVQREAVATASEDDDVLERGVNAFCRWCLRAPDLLAAAVLADDSRLRAESGGVRALAESVEDLRQHLQEAVDAGRLHPDAAGDEAIALFTSMMAGLLSQQIANQPDASFEDGRFSRLLPVVLEMFYQRYAPNQGVVMTAVLAGEIGRPAGNGAGTTGTRRSRRGTTCWRHSRGPSGNVRTVCDEWDVADIAGHLIGQAEDVTRPLSFPLPVPQGQAASIPRVPRFDAHMMVQADEHRGTPPAELRAGVRPGSGGRRRGDLRGIRR